MTFKITVHIRADANTSLCLGNQTHRTFTFGAKGKNKSLALANIRAMLEPLNCPEHAGELMAVKEQVARVIDTTNLGMARTRNATGFNWEIRMEQNDE